MTPPTLETIPRDARFLIIDHLSERKDLTNLCQVSKTLLYDTLPRLYRSLSLHAPEYDIEELPLESVVEAGHKGFLRHTREIRVWSHFHTKTFARCTHINDDDHDPIDPDGDTGILARKLQDMLSACDAGSIQTLIWDMGTCVPQSLLGPNGYFKLHQPNLETIRLVTDGGCYSNKHRDRRLALSAFPRLKRLSWKGVSSMGDVESLADALTQRSRQLEELEIDLTQRRDRPEPGRFRENDYLWLVEILGLPERGSGTFPALRKLALSSAWLGAGRSESTPERVLRGIRTAFDFSGLSSLCLRDCGDWEDLLEALTISPQPIRLRDLEIQVSDKSEPTGNAHIVICAFLRTFQGLEGLFLYTSDFEESIELWRALSYHRATLVRFVQHQRSMILRGGSDRFGDRVDSVDLSVEYPENVDAGPGNPLAQLDLVVVGLCCIPRFMRAYVSPFASKDSLQVLHMRRSGTDLGGYRRSATDPGYYSWIERAEEEDMPFDSSGMDVPEGWRRSLGQSFADFAQWAFGPTGIRSLKLLAYGDFSYDGRFKRTTILLRRREAPPGNVDDGQFLYFDELRASQDWELWELYKRESHVLAACPTDTLFRDW